MGRSLCVWFICLILAFGRGTYSMVPFTLERPDQDTVEQTIREEVWRIAEMRQVSATARGLKA